MGPGVVGRLPMRVYACACVCVCVCVHVHVYTRACARLSAWVLLPECLYMLRVHACVPGSVCGCACT